ATKFSVSPAWVRRLKQRRRDSGEVGPRPQRHGPLPLSVTHADALKAAVAARPDATLAELREGLGLGVALSTMWEARDALALPVKKSRAGGGAGQGGREGGAPGASGGPAAARPGPPRVPRRDGHDDEHGPALRAFAQGQASGGQGAARALEGDHRGGGAPPGR